MELLNKRVRLTTKRGFRYSGPVIDESPEGLIILDRVSGHEVFIVRDWLAEVEVLP